MNKIICFVFGHNFEQVGTDIDHFIDQEDGRVGVYWERDFNCLRCEHKVTNVIKVATCTPESLDCC